MFHHTVLLHLRPSFDAASEAAFDALAAEVLDRCEGLRAYALRRNEAASRGVYDHVLFSAFADRASFRAYDRAEVHDRIKALLAPHLVGLVVADGGSTDREGRDG